MKRDVFGAVLALTVVAFLGCDPKLMKAANEGAIEEIKTFLAAGGDVNATGDRWGSGKFFGKTALMEAASGGHIEIVELLLAHGADVNVKSRGTLGVSIFERTALMEAASGGHIEIVELLLAHGADVNVKDNKGKTALMEAALGKVKFVLDDGGLPIGIETSWTGHAEIVEILLAHGAEVNAKENDGWTALMAAARGHTEIVEILLAHGAEVNAKDDKGKTALGASVMGTLGASVIGNDVGKLPTILLLRKAGAVLGEGDDKVAHLFIESLGDLE